MTERYIDPQDFELQHQFDERIEDGVWRPGILDRFQDKVVAGASTKELTATSNRDFVFRIMGDKNRFDRPVEDRLAAGRALAKLRNAIGSEADLHHVVKSQLNHTAEVAVIDEEFVKDLEKGNLHEKQIFETDGLITNLPDYPLYVSGADCFPVGLYDPEHGAIGVFHSGFKGTVNKIVENGIQKMKDAYGSDPSKLVAVIAPGIAGYRIDTNMKHMVENAFGASASELLADTEQEGQYIFDIKAGIQHSLESAGVSEQNIQATKFSTNENNDLFPSDRGEFAQGKDRSKIERLGFMMTLKN